MAISSFRWCARVCSLFHIWCMVRMHRHTFSQPHILCIFQLNVSRKYYLYPELWLFLRVSFEQSKIRLALWIYSYRVRESLASANIIRKALWSAMAFYRLHNIKRFCDTVHSICIHLVRPLNYNVRMWCSECTAHTHTHERWAFGCGQMQSRTRHVCVSVWHMSEDFQLLLSGAFIV